MANHGKWKRENGKWSGKRVSAIFHFPISLFRRFGWWLRQVTGDAAYENYLRAAPSERECTHQHRLMTREEFYLDYLQRRYTGVSRCC